MEREKQMLNEENEQQKEHARRISAGIWLFLAFFCFLGVVDNESLFVIILATVNLIAAWRYGRRHLKMFHYE